MGKDDKDLGRYVAIIAGAVPLVIWAVLQNSMIANLALKIYLLTSLLFGLLLTDKFPRSASKSFWKAVGVVSVLHGVVVLLLIAIEPVVFEMKVTSIGYSIVGAILFLEWAACLQIIAFLEATDKKRSES
jgi:hypothetical protein